MTPRPRWDIFCTVVDNYGDIGVCWRLARQLAGAGRTVRLWVDNLASLARIAPAVDRDRDAQLVAGVEIRRWDAAFGDVHAADTVVEAFGCQLPDHYVSALARRRQSEGGQPAWINLEYLSAESWVDRTHALPSPHPRLPLTKYFFFPGFTENTGGLLREAGLLEARDAFQADASAQAAFWESMNLSPRREAELRVSLFGYANAVLPALLDSFARGPEPVTCIVPEGALLDAARGWFGSAAGPLERGHLTVHPMAFVDQDRYDRLLWACDVNFVRGEDSFVRAQWAARPMVWNVYPQDDGAHLVKLDAFLDRYLEGIAPAQAARMRHLWHGWNGSADPAGAWRNFIAARRALQAHAQDWCARLATRPDLASALANFCDNLL